MLTASMIYQVCQTVNPRSTPLKAYVDAFSCSAGVAELNAWGINTPARLAAFMANVCHETGGLTIIRENMNYRSSRVRAVWSRRRAAKVLRAIRGKVYGTNAYRMGIADGAYGDRLGNEDDGTNDHDGYNFRGGGPLQATGRNCYQFLERETGLPFTKNPDLIEAPEHWVKVAALTWCKHGHNLNPFADNGNFKACCLAINCGSPYRRATPVGWRDRQTWFKVWRRVLSAAPQDAERQNVNATPLGVTYCLGMPYNETVRAAQARLNALGYADKRLTVDGLYGPRTRSAVQDFETESGFTVTGMLNPETLTLLMSPDAKRWPVPAEALDGIAGLRKAGDKEIKAADTDKTVATLLLAGGAAKAAQEAGVLDTATELSKDAGTMQTAFKSLLEVLQFGITNLLPVVLIFGGVLLWLRYGAAIQRRLAMWSRPSGE